MFALVTELAYVLVEDQPDFVGSTTCGELCAFVPRVFTGCSAVVARLFWEQKVVLKRLS